MQGCKRVALVVLMAGCGNGDGGALDGGAAGDPLECFETREGIAVIEGEQLPFVDEWRVGRDADASGGAYLEWSADSHNNDTSFGRFELTLRLANAGTYVLDIHTRIGRGDNPTEHNDLWMQIADAGAFYGRRDRDGAESRVLPRPLCMDDDALAAQEAEEGVGEVRCPEGSSRDGYFKVYSSGARDWRWSARTSDNDAHTLVVRVDAPGDVTLQLAARADFMQVDRLVFYEEGVDRDLARDLTRASTPCR
ncbi:MAG: hypothetical protein AAF447_00235 [Myxococcota bacterium]